MKEDERREMNPEEKLKEPRSRMILAVYALLAIALTWPLAANLTNHIPGGNNDLFQNYWNLWLWKTSLFEQGASPYSTELLFSGTKTSLAFHTHSPANTLLALPFLLVLGEAAALSFATLCGFILAAFGAYLLTKELLGDWRGAFLAGTVFAFFPQHFEQSLEHLNLASYGAMPLFLLWMVRAIREPSSRSWIYCGLFFALNCLFAWHNGLLLLPGALALFLNELRKRPRERKLVITGASIAALVAILACLPFASAMLSELVSGTGSPTKPQVNKPLDLAFLAIPSAQHPLFGSLVSGIHDQYRSYNSVGFTAYLGLATILLAMSTLFFRFKRRDSFDSFRNDSPRLSLRFWSFFALFFLLLGLGAELRFLKTDTGLPLPFALFRELPGFSSLRVANRFLVPAMLGISVLAGAGACLWLRDSVRPKRLLGIFIAAVILDFLWVPYPTRELPRPEWTLAAAKAPEGALLNIPGGYRARAAEDMYLQTLHGRPITGGYVSVTPPHVKGLLERHPFLRSIFEAEHSRTYPEEPIPALEGLNALFSDESIGIGVVVLHTNRSYEELKAKRDAASGLAEKLDFNPAKGNLRAKLDECGEALRTLWGKPLYKDDQVEVYGRPRE